MSRTRACWPASLLLLVCVAACAVEPPPGIEPERAPATDPAAAPDLAVEVETELPPALPGDAVRDPIAAWRAARALVPPDGLVRRIAFARHGLFLFHSGPGDEAVLGTFIGRQDGAWRPEEPTPHDAAMFTAPGAQPEAIEPALQRLLASDEFIHHAARLDSFFLESHEAELFWSLMPVPEGGFREGVTIETVRLPFEP